MNFDFNGLELFGQFRHMLVFVLLNKNSEDVHKRSERMIFIFANFIGDTVEQFHDLLVVGIAMRHPDGA